MGCCASLWLVSFFISGLSAGAWDRAVAFLLCFWFWFPVGKVALVSHFAVSLVVVSAFCVFSYFGFLLLLGSTIVVHDLFTVSWLILCDISMNRVPMREAIWGVE